MKNNRYCVIMAGGVGSRFWPKSRKSMPKQFLDILGRGKSFIRETYERFLPLVDSANILVVTNEMYKEIVLEQIPELLPEQVLCEPIGRNTAPCVAYAAYHLAKINPDAEMIVTPSDHFISDEELFHSTITRCLDFATTHNALMTIGIKPTRPECGYGYIQLSEKEPISKVKCFTEKPNLEMAQLFLDSGEFMWNSGIFVWHSKAILDAFTTYTPELDSLFKSIESELATPAEGAAISEVFSQCKSISIDYAIMEKASNVYVAQGEFGWSDVGTWGSLFDHAELDSNGNIASDNSFLYDTTDSVISVSDSKTVVISGLKEYIVVDSEDILMICPRSDEQNIKKFIGDIKYSREKSTK